MNSYLQKLIERIARIYINTPFYPHWLEFRESRKLHGVMLNNLASRLDDKASVSILEIGCASQKNKAIFSKFLPVSYYCGLDYPQWWISQNTEIGGTKHNENQQDIKYILKDIIFGNQNIKADVWGDGLQLPFRDSFFDIVTHFEVMEHVSSTEILFQEISRCLNDDGYLIFSLPFVYQNHSSFDISRLTKQGIEALCQRHKLKILTDSSTGFGTTISQLTNSFIIKNIVGFHNDSSSLIRKVTTALFATVFLFPIINIVTLIIDKVWFDSAYANHHYFLCQKQTTSK